MADKKVSLGKEFTKGLIKENPVLRLVLGTCPTLAISTSVVNALGMGISAPAALQPALATDLLHDAPFALR